MNTITNPSKEVSSVAQPLSEVPSDPPLPVTAASSSFPSKNTTKEETAIPSYMLTPVSSIGTPTITLEGNEPPLPPFAQNTSKETGLKSGHEEENPLPHNLLHSSSRLPKLDTTSGNGGSNAAAAHALFKQLLPDTFESTRGLNIPTTKSQVNIH